MTHHLSTEVDFIMSVVKDPLHYPGAGPRLITEKDHEAICDFIQEYVICGYSGPGRKGVYEPDWKPNLHTNCILSVRPSLKNKDSMILKFNLVGDADWLSQRRNLVDTAYKLFNDRLAGADWDGAGLESLLYLENGEPYQTSRILPRA